MTQHRHKGPWLVSIISPAKKKKRKRRRRSLKWRGKTWTSHVGLMPHPSGENTLAASPRRWITRSWSLPIKPCMEQPMYKNWFIRWFQHEISALVAAICWTSLTPGGQLGTRVSRRQLRFSGTSFLKQSNGMSLWIHSKLAWSNIFPDCLQLVWPKLVISSLVWLINLISELLSKTV